MTVFIRMTKPNSVGAYIVPKLLPGVSAIKMRSGWGIALEWEEATLELTSGKDAGNTVKSLAPTQRGTLHLGIVSPKKYQVLVVVNPALYEACTVQGPALIEPGEVGLLTLHLHAHKAFHLEDWTEWFVRLYAIE